MKSCPVLITAFALLFASSTSIAARADEPVAAVRILPALKLYDGVPPNSPAYPDAEKSIDVRGTRALLNVSEPTLTPVLPVPGRSNGAAVIVVPGGAYIALAIDYEGFNEARWLAARGITAFVLKYRIQPTSGDLAEMGRAAAAKPPNRSASAYDTFSFAPAVLDAQAAIRLVRNRAAQWGVDPARVGMLGFSAGSISTLLVATGPAKTNRPDFIGAIYPPLEKIAVPTDAPPMFIAIAMDDELFAGKGFGLLESWQNARRPIEAHLYERGGHGFGMGKPDTTTTDWIGSFFDWLKMRQIIPAKK